MAAVVSTERRWKALWLLVPLCTLMFVMWPASDTVNQHLRPGVAETESVGSAPSASPLSEQQIQEILRQKLAKVRQLHGALDKISDDNGNVMGHTGQQQQQTTELFKLVRDRVRNSHTICEIGFNVGHSAVTFLEALEGVKEFWAFDIASNPAVEKSMQYLEKEYPQVRFTLLKGLSQDTVPKANTDFPDLVCDFVHIDGRHDSGVPAADFENMRHLVHKTSYIVFDDCGCKGPISDYPPWCVEPTEVFQALISDKKVSPDSFMEVSYEGKGSCTGYPGPALTVGRQGKLI